MRGRLTRDINRPASVESGGTSRVRGVRASNACLSRRLLVRWYFHWAQPGLCSRVRIIQMHRRERMLRVSEISAAEVNQYRAALCAKLTELEAGAHQLDDIAAERAPDAMDDSAFANDRDFAVERLVQITSLLTSVRSALVRIADGSYGVCTDCGEAISPKRLAVLPWAAYCRPCQEKLDVLRDASSEHPRASVVPLN